jgi:hypothetical protein
VLPHAPPEQLAVKLQLEPLPVHEPVALAPLTLPLQLVPAELKLTTSPETDPV